MPARPEIKPELSGAIREALTPYGLTTKGPFVAAESLLRDLCAELYQFGDGSHDERIKRVDDRIGTALYEWVEQQPEDLRTFSVIGIYADTGEPPQRFAHEVHAASAADAELAVVERRIPELEDESSAEPVVAAVMEDGEIVA